MTPSLSEICPFCHQLARFLFSAPDPNTEKLYQIFYCSSCDVGFLPKDSVPQDIGSCYETEGYYSEFQEESQKRPSPLLYLLENFFTKIRISRLLKYKSSGNLLDVGCGSGKFLQACSSHFNGVYGIEPSQQGRNFSIRKGIKVDPSLTESSFFEHSFDAITFWQSLEHINDPLRALKKAHRLLIRSGVLLVSVPNFGSVERILFGKNWFHLDPPRHVFHFTERFLKNMLEQAGFKIVHIYHLSLEYDVPSILQSLLNVVGIGRNVLKKTLKYRQKQSGIKWVWPVLPWLLIPMTLIWVSGIILKNCGTLCVIARPE